eukprot:2723179-Lingulodinium_polyedra.AAC.1
MPAHRGPVSTSPTICCSGTTWDGTRSGRVLAWRSTGILRVLEECHRAPLARPRCLSRRQG